MSEKKTSKSQEKALNIVGVIFILIIAVQIGIALFGSWFEADKAMLRKTAKAQEDLHNALLLGFNDFGRFEIRYDYTVRAYISKENYMLVPYPDRDETIATVGKAWCKNKAVIRWYMPKVVLRDIQTGEDLGSYGCLLGFTSKK